MIKIKLSEEATRPRPAREAWGAILTVSIMFGLILGIQVLVGHIPSLKSIGALIFLNALWAYMVYLVSGNGWRKIPWTFWVILIAISVLNGKYIFPNSFLTAEPLQTLSQIAIFATFLPQFLTITRKKPEVVAATERVGANR